MFHGLKQFAKPLSAPRRTKHDRDAKPHFKPLRVNMYSAFSCFINKVYAYDDLLRDFDNLKRKRKASLKAGCVKNNRRRIRFPLFKKIPCNRFLPRTRAQRVAAGKIHKLPRLLFAFAAAKFYCFARPIPRVLFQSRKRIEHGAFADVRIARKRNDGKIRCFKPALRRTAPDR